MKAFRKMLLGITPAYAGKSCRRSGRSDRRQDHPRLCGEKHRRRARRNFLQGSPPPMRGKEPVVLLTLRHGGITPAYAGKRWQFALLPFGMRDHPRLCGEKSQSKSADQSRLGSPPPMRGKVPRSWGSTGMRRITPAYAGKRTVSPFSFTCFWDHPRLCGEKAFSGRIRKAVYGSPPPMRGKD